MQPEPAEPPFSAHDAARALDGIRGLDQGLRHRVEGMTWAIWGLVSAGIFLSYGFAESAMALPMPAWAQQLWLPWVAAGFLVTAALWYTASLASPHVGEGTAGGWIHLVAWVSFILGSLFLFQFILDVALNTALLMMFILATAAILFGASPFLGYSRLGKKAAVITGAALLVAAMAGAWLGISGAGASVYGAIMSGSAWIIAGIYQIIRG